MDPDDLKYGALRDQLMKRARRMVRNEADAEDVVQTALERAWRGRGQFRENAAVAPWLLKITTHAAIDHLRGNARHEELTGEVPHRSEALEALVLRDETFGEIASAIQELSQPYREAFLLHDVHGFSSREISDGRALPYHTVRTHLHRARKHLRRALSEATS